MSNSKILPAISDDKGNTIKIPNSARILSSPLDGNNDNLGCIVSDYTNNKTSLYGETVQEDIVGNHIAVVLHNLIYITKLSVKILWNKCKKREEIMQMV